MSTRSFCKCLLLAAMLLFISSALATAGLFTSIVVYGDSLSDNGNLYAASGNLIPGAPYYQGRRSDGLLAVEQLATSLGTPGLLMDFAWIGATTGIGNYGDLGTPTTVGPLSLPGMQTEFAATQASLGPFLAGGLFIVWGGANDFLSPSPLDSTPGDVISRGVGNIVGIVTALQGLGAQHILVPGLPDLGLTPYFTGLGQGAFASALTDAFNATLLASLPPGVMYYDTASLVRDMVANPAAYGFTNVTAPCFDGVATVCANPGEYLFFDDFHPTTATNSFVARGFEDIVTPEPGTISLLAGLALFAALRRRRS